MRQWLHLSLLRLQPERQRFQAEIRFLKKYDALESYLHTYLAWLKPRLAGDAQAGEIRYIEQVLKENTDEENKKPLKYRDLIKALRKIQNYTEYV